MPELIELLQGGMVPEDEFYQENTETDLQPGVDDEKLWAILRTRIDEAVNYAEEELAGRREEEQQYYDGELMPGDENLDNTRSKIISRDVHDTVHAILPSLLRVFFSGKSVVAYEPQGPEDEAFAEQATQYVNEVILKQDNDGFSIFYDVFHDALAKGLGTVIWYWSPEFRVEGEQYRGISEPEYQAVVMDRNVTGLNVLRNYPDAFGNMLYDCDVHYRFEDGGKVILEAVPPEERLIDKRAKSIDDSEIYGRRRVMTVSEGTKMGYDYDQLVKLGGAELLDTNEEATDRYDSHIFDASLNIKMCSYGLTAMATAMPNSTALPVVAINTKSSDLPMAPRRFNLSMILAVPSSAPIPYPTLLPGAPVQERSWMYKKPRPT
jgi:hypothetical protein